MAQINLSNHSKVQVTENHINVDQELIHITEDKLRLILKDHLDSLSQAGSWVTPFSLLISIVATLCTAKFETFIGVSPESWQTIFALVGISSFFLLLKALIKKRKMLTHDDFINKVKNKR